jgi:tetratricopeptide (TPR) repeat protein
MGFRMRKSVKLGPGVRITASHRGASLRVGGRGGGYSMSTTGRRTVSGGIPGSGIGYQKSWSGGGGRARRASAPVPVSPPAPPKPGLLAPGYEKAFCKALQHFVNGDVKAAAALFEESSAKDSGERVLADDLFAGLLRAQLEDEHAAIPYLEKVVRSDQALPDELMDKYVAGGGIVVAITDEVKVEVPFGSLAAALTLAEVYQRTGRRDEAIGLVQQLVEVDPHPFLVLSLADLYAEAEAWDEIVDLAAGTTNEDDVTLQVRLLQARAFREQGMADAAIEAYKDCLRSKKRAADLLKEARYERALLYANAGKKAQARKELEKLYAEDSSYRDVKERLAAVGT